MGSLIKLESLILLLGLVMICSLGINAAATLAKHRRLIEAANDEDEQPRPRPFRFSYSAGRAPNSQPDRYVEQEGTEDGVIRGTYSYLDPNWTWQVIKYEADPEGGFRILEGSTLDTTHPKDTEAVARARAEHATLFANIAAAHETPDEDGAAVPVESAAVQQKRTEHQNLYRKIAEEHRAIAEQHKKLAEQQEQELRKSDS